MTNIKLNSTDIEQAICDYINKNMGCKLDFLDYDYDELSIDLEKYDLEIPYKTYGTFVTSSVMDASQIGSSLRSDNEKKATEVLSLTGQAPLTQEEQIQTVYTPVSPDGSTTAGVDLYNTLIVREAGTFDRIGLSLGRMMAYRNAIDGTKSTDNICLLYTSPSPRDS